MKSALPFGFIIFAILAIFVFVVGGWICAFNEMSEKNDAKRAMMVYQNEVDFNRGEEKVYIGVTALAVKRYAELSNECLANIGVK